MSYLRLENIGKKIKGKEILKNISFELNKGEIVGFVGPNGAGKTTTIKMILGILSTESGDIFINDKNIKDKDGMMESLKSISNMIESPALYSYLTGYENLKQILRSDKRIDKKFVDEVIELVNLKESINEKVKNYSLGMKQRLAIAQALITKPKLLILDEPTNGLDPVGIVEIRNILKNFSIKEGAAVLISSHILGELEQLCDKVIFINNGEIVRKEILDESKNLQVIIMPRVKSDCINVLKGIEIVRDIKEYDNGILVDVRGDNIYEIIYKLAEKRIDIDEIYNYRETLEEKYMEVYS
ncbi:MAG: ABC transporter ATP-binding protein [Clostridium chrysemydis]|uniref:ABC transporter ATP-binding protein n=1 Tax=Clostridium TaxID=1485 RepID=UPI00215270BC|nr:ABC transporter ATP-binding protein [Clostridium sp. LY3-2]MCR6514625.1 ABC transporter ATP-binding protein [Clostridium sp. LY3-2]